MKMSVCVCVYVCEIHTYLIAGYAGFVFLSQILATVPVFVLN